MRETKRELVLRLQKLRKEKNYSYQYLVNETENRGKAVSISSIKRIFAEGGENGDYRYETTLKPLVEILCEGDGDETEEVIVEQREALQTVLELKSSMLEEKNQIIAEQKMEIAFLKSAIKLTRNYQIVTLVIIILLSLSIYLLVDYFAFPTSWLLRA